MTLLTLLLVPLDKHSVIQLEPEQINKILLVGGATRMPMIQNIIRDLFGKEGDKSINPDECVALGAAAQAGFHDRLPPGRGQEEERAA